MAKQPDIYGEGPAPGADRTTQTPAGTPTTSSTGPSASGQGQSGSEGAVGQAQQTVGPAVNPAKPTISQGADQVPQQASAQASSQVDRAAQGLGNTAGSVRAVSQQLREKDQARLAQYSDRAAEQMERFASYLQGKDVNQLVGEVKQLARREPALFLGGALALGLLTAARFLKRSRRRGASKAATRRPGPSQPPTEGRLREAVSGNQV